MAFEHSDNYSIAITKFEEMLNSNEVRFFDAEEFESIIGHYLELGRIQLAKKALSMALEQHPKSVELLLMKVEILVFDNQLDQADEILSGLHSIEPRNEEVYIQKANVFSKKGMHEKSILSLKYALELTSDPADVLSLMGMEYMMNDRHLEAIKCFKDCLMHDPQDEAALYNIVYCYEYLKKPKKAIKFLSEYLNDFPYSETAWHQLGVIFFNSKKYRKALAAFDFAIISDDEFLGAYIEKAKTLEKLKCYQEAIEVYKISFEIDEPTAYVYMRIGRCYLKLKQKQTAVTYFKKAVKDDPLLESGWMALTGYYYDKHDYNKALYYINKALDIDFDNVKYWKQYAYINLKLNYLEEAEYGFKRSLELGNFELSTWLERADVLRNLGEIKAAIFDLEEALEFYPNEVEILYRLSGLHFLLNQHSIAKTYLRKAHIESKDAQFIAEILFPEMKEHKEYQKLF